MTDTEPFNLRALVRQTMTDSVIADPGQLADVVLANIKRKDRDEALSQALRTFVRQVFSESRLITQINLSGHAPSVQAGRSAKVDGIREHWRRALRDRVNVGAGSWKLLGDCDATDLMFMSGFRREQAARNMAKAAQYDALGSLLDEHGVERVKDLPTSTLAAVLGRVA